MDGRQALAPGAELKLSTRTGYTSYVITKEIGRGGSCIAYDASYKDNLGNYKLVRIKECYPHALKIERAADDTLLPTSRDEEAFTAAKERLVSAYQKNHDLFGISALSNTVANISNIYQENGTVYIVSVYMNGRTFADYKGETLHDCISLLLSAAKVLQRIHEAGYLYLDLKPDNILTIEGSLDLVQLFDFDSMISIEELEYARQSETPQMFRTSYTKGYAPLELQTGKLKQIDKHTDLYSLGAVLFEALWHRTPTAFECDVDAAFDFTSMTYPARGFQDRLFREMAIFFHHTLASFCGDRYQDDTEAIAQLQTLLTLSDETVPFILSTPIQPSPVFYGREKELDNLHKLLTENEHHTVSLYGMGGIGKSTLARQYLIKHMDDWNAVLWMYDQGNLTESIADDATVHVNTVTRMKEESAEDYFKRKLQAVSALAHTQRILMVLDNFVPEHLEQLQPINQTNVTLLLISRERLAEGLFPAMLVGEMDSLELARMFAHYSGVDLTDDENMWCFQSIMDMIDRHTLLTELIGRQVAKSYLDLEETEAMVAGIGLRDMPAEKIDYVHDQSVFHGTLIKILDRLVEIDRFTDADRECMKMLAFFDTPGIEAVLFKSLAELPSLDLVNNLEEAGWLKSSEGNLYLHPMMQEYVLTWPWQEGMNQIADRMMKKLYGMIRPAGNRYDGNKQFPTDYDRLYRLLRVAEQMVSHTEEVTEASQHLLYRLLMDSPVDQDTSVMFRMLELLKNPKYLDADSVLRLYENAAYYRARLYDPEEAINILREMKRYLRKHPSAYYLSAYHRAMAVILHNADQAGNLKKCLRHEDRAIAAVRVSRHPDAKKQLAACLLNKARTLLNANMDTKQAHKLIEEAKPLIEQHADITDYETYQFDCTAAMCFAMEGDIQQAEIYLRAADNIVFSAPDSDLAVIEHLIDEDAPILIEMDRFDQATDAVLQAIDMCNRHQDAIRYRETRFDAYRSLGEIYALKGEYVKAENAFSEAEQYVSDSPYAWKLPLCPEEIREKAKEVRAGVCAAYAGFL